ncbi:glycine-rich domain-containing protein 1 isoform X2 [Raphanus sativus]|uniref:Glycine-rich domain-containing protein 1 isoform X1 n=1 Tax=Raphanus sativus TaxID=3726 RepID=A0A9W3DGR4_RAPSA|nr:glycine-rich domain-containing protein 1 isoform X1 [Raphanus sativus]XP_056863091.1 glycine-rich domain-containing protein 1 isoform X2 [Raphanus sativus]
MDHEVEWLEAQKIETSVDLLAAAKQQLLFLAAVDRNRRLYDGHALDRAIYRYNACWLPLLAKHSESSSSLSEGPLVPPLDCEWIWHCHRLNPVRYKSDCEQFYGRVLDVSGVVSSVNGNCKLKTEELWKKLYPEEPYDLDLDKVVSEKISDLEKCTKYDLVSAVKRQSPFYYQVSRTYVSNDVFLQEAVARYKGFLYLIKKNRERSLRRFCVPTYDVDLIWHTHQLHPVAYCNDLEKLIGKVLEHDDTDSDRGKGKKLDTGFSNTTAQWEETFGRRYWKAGAMYRGSTPAPVATSPYVSDVLAKEPNTKDDLIQVPEVEVIEVLLEIIEVSNIPDGHKGKLSVVFSKTQPDSLFDAERRLTILSEAGEKQVAFFQCEPTGELHFHLVSSSPSKIPVSREPKNLGFASLSLNEFFSPVITQLSVEKWLEVTPSKGSKTDPKPISLRVAVSFTPPTCCPSVLHMVQSRPSCKGSCFFPIIRKSRHAKSSTHVVDETETEVISLQMSDGAALKGDYTAQRQVIGEMEFGETRVLAEYTGTFWSLLDSKWSLKQTNVDNPLFELLGIRVVKFFSGRKLDYEPKHCAKRRSEEDFMTLVEFSKQHPYGKAVALLDLKFGSIEAKENWLVLPGIVSAFILNTHLKKGGSNGFDTTTKMAQQECLKSNVLKEESKETRLVATVETKVKGNTTNGQTVAAIIAPEKGSGCGGGGCSGECGNMVKAAMASGCGSGCSGVCGDMMKATNASGCGSGCSGECGDMMKSTKASGCGGGCSGECGEMMKATKASGCGGGGCSGECGDMVKAANASGCGGGCSGECGDMVKAAKASGCGGGCSGECGNMVKAAKAGGCGGGCSGECGDMVKAA